MTLDLDVQRLLRSPEIRSINFRLGACLVTGEGFRQVSDCFSDTFQRHRIRITTRESIVGHNALASYQPSTDKVNVASRDILSTARGRAMMVHECTHAQFDLRSATVPRLQEEGSAFITHAWYLLNSGEDITDPAFVLTKPLVDVARAIVGRQTRAGSQVVATAAEVITVTNEMQQRYRYRPGNYLSNGIRGRRYRQPQIEPNPYVTQN